MGMLLLRTIMAVIVCFTHVMVPHARALCPNKCTCNEDRLETHCVNATLEFVPIQLNPDLRYLNLTHNKVVSLHYTLSVYLSLKTLDLSNNRIQTLGQMNFDAQKNLNYLNVSNNFIKTLGKDTFKGLERLQTLDLSRNNITHITPAALSDLTSLEILYLDGNSLISFEANVLSKLAKLRVLSVNNNQILEIPTNILRDVQTTLEQLDLSHNLIKVIYNESFSHMSALTHVDLRANIISEIATTAFHELSNLKHLDLSENNLTRVPTEQLSKLVNLAMLDLSGNFIEVIEPLAFKSLFLLQTLNLNRLDYLYSLDTRAFVDNINVEILALEANPKLTKLNMSLFDGCQKLHTISLKNNVFETLSPMHLPLHKLRLLQISGHQFHCNCSLFWLKKLIEQNPMDAVDKSGKGFYVDGKVLCHTPKEYAQKNLLEIPDKEISCNSDWSQFILMITVTVFVILTLASLVFYIIWLKCLPMRTDTSTMISYNYPNSLANPSSLVVDQNIMTSIRSSNTSGNSYVNNLKRNYDSSNQSSNTSGFQNKMPNDLLANDPWYQHNQGLQKKHQEPHVVFV